MNPTMIEAEEAARLLNIGVDDLARYLRDAAAKQLELSAIAIRQGFSPDLAGARRLVRAAEACEEAHDEVQRVKA